MIPTLWIALISAATAGAQCIQVSGDRILAGDLAGTIGAFASLAPETEIAISPMPGVTRNLSAAELSKALGAAVAWGTCVKRAARFLSADEIMAALRKSLQGDEANVTVLDYSRAPIPEGQIEFTRSGLSMSLVPSNTSAIWHGRVQCGNGRSGAIWAKVRISKPAKVFVARRMLPSRRVLSIADVEEREIDYYSLTPPPVFDPGKLGEFEAAREIRAGTVIQPWMLRAKTAIKKGDPLRVSANTSGAQLKFETNAECEGRVGDRILVRNPLNGRLVAAIIRGEGIAEIDVDRKNHGKDPESSSHAGPAIDERDVSRETQGLPAGSH